MKALKKLTQNQLIGLLSFAFVVVLGVVLISSNNSTELNKFNTGETPPMVQIDTGYNATLSGEPFYVVDDSDEDFEDNLDVCDEFGAESYRRGVQNGWYQIVAYEDDLSVEEVIFEQIDLEEGDRMVAVMYNAEDQEWMAWPNKIIIDEDGDNVELLDRDEKVTKGTVIAVSADADVDYCSDYEEIGDHENIELKWNLVSRPDFDDVDYRTIWEVAFAKGGNSGVDLERYYSTDDPDNSTPPNQLPGDELYWVYGGQAGMTDGGEDLPDEELVCDEYEIRVTADYSNYTPSGSENLETNVANGLDEQPWLYATYDNFEDFNENFERLREEGAVVTAQCGPEVTVCTDFTSPGMELTVRNQSGDLVKNATILVTQNGNEADRQVNSNNSGSADSYTLLDTNDISGAFNVNVTANDYLAQDLSVVVTEDDCENVVTLTRDIILKDATKDVFDVTVSLVDANDDPISLGLVNISPTAGTNLEAVDGSTFKLLGAVEGELFSVGPKENADPEYIAKIINVDDRDSSDNLTVTLDEATEKDFSALDRVGSLSIVGLNRTGSTLKVELESELEITDYIDTGIILTEVIPSEEEGENGQILGIIRGSDLSVSVANDNELTITTDALPLEDTSYIGVFIVEEALKYEDANGDAKTNYTYAYNGNTEEEVNYTPEFVEQAQAEQQAEENEANNSASNDSESSANSGNAMQFNSRQLYDSSVLHNLNQNVQLYDGSASSYLQNFNFSTGE